MAGFLLELSLAWVLSEMLAVPLVVPYIVFDN